MNIEIKFVLKIAEVRTKCFQMNFVFSKWNIVAWLQLTIHVIDWLRDPMRKTDHEALKTATGHEVIMTLPQTC